jgi:transposase
VLLRGYNSGCGAKLVKVNRKTGNNYSNDLREKILKEMPRNDGEFKLDESYFGAKRVRGKRGRGAAGRFS